MLAGKQESEPWKESMRLQPYVVPVLYDLMIRPDFECGRFYGHVTITVDVKPMTTYFAVHMKNLKINSTKVVRPSEKGNVFPVMKRTFYYEPYELWIIEMEDVIKAGSYNLSFEFEGTLKHGGEATCKHHIGGRLTSPRKKSTITHMPLQAREAYPCFDEPAMKVKFKMRLVKPIEKYVAVTNELVEKEEFVEDKNEITVYFKETKPMSPFFTRFIITDPDSTPLLIESQNTKFPIKIYTVPEKMEKASYVKEIAGQVAKFYNDYFDVPFPLSTLDLVSLYCLHKTDIRQWGFITFSDICSHYDERPNAIESKKIPALIVSREVCQQWFGSLVTLKWWDDMWLIQGFAILMQYKSLEERVQSCVDWKLSEQVVIDCIHAVMDTDASLGSHPLQLKVEKPEDIRNIFDTVSFHKGFAILRMLESFAGRENFRRGIHRFLEVCERSAASSSDLWNCIGIEVNDSYLNASSMETWTKQSGFPVIYAIRRANTWVLSQSRFLTDCDAYSDTKESPYEYKWDIPITYITSKDKRPSMVWFKRSEEYCKITVTDRSISFLKFNAGQSGFYRVNYEGCLWQQFCLILRQDHKKLESLDRANLIDDVFHSAEAWQTEYHYALDLVSYLENEHDFLPWATASRNLKKLLSHLPNTYCYGLIMKYIRCLLAKHYGVGEDQFNWVCNENETHVTRLLRVVILDLACLSKLPDCMKDLEVHFRSWIATGKIPVQPELERLLMCYGMRETGTVEDWEIVLKRYQEETDPTIRNCLLESLANIKDYWLIKGLLENGKYEMPKEEYPFFIQSVAENPYTTFIHCNYIINEYEYLCERYPSHSRQLSNVILSMSKNFSTGLQLFEVKELFKKQPNICPVEQDRVRVLEEIERNIQFIKRHKEVIRNWLVDYLNI